MEIDNSNQVLKKNDLFADPPNQAAPREKLGTQLEAPPTASSELPRSAQVSSFSPSPVYPHPLAPGLWPAGLVLSLGRLLWAAGKHFSAWGQFLSTLPQDSASLGPTLERQMNAAPPSPTQQAPHALNALNQEQCPGSDERQQTAKLALLGQLAAGVAHEISQPLLIVRTVAFSFSRAVDKGHLPDFDKFYLLTQRLEKAGEKIASISGSLKTMARDERKDPMVAASLQRCVDEALELCTAQLRYHDVQLIHAEKADSLGTSIKEQAYMVLCRPGQITQIVLNLLSNSFDAVRHLPEKWICLELQETEKYYLLSVSDSGRGIPEEVITMLMTPFFTTKGPSEGMGLGLSISSSFAKEHGGSLYYKKSAANTQFILELPKLETARAEANRAEATRTAVEEPKLEAETANEDVRNRDGSDEEVASHG